jgi:septal ring factor EnvC (AmiA/AmiB activator)
LKSSSQRLCGQPEVLDLTGFLPVLWYNELNKNGRKNMPRSAKDIQLTELKNTISKRNELITTQTKSMDSLQKTIEELRQELSNKQAEVDYLKAKLFGSSSEKCKSPFPGQMNLFKEMPDERGS